MNSSVKLRTDMGLYIKVLAGRCKAAYLEDHSISGASNIFGRLLLRDWETQAEGCG